MTQEVKPLSRSEREAQIKDKAGLVICVLAALLAINTLMGNSNSGKILNNTIEANNTWSFYQAKAIKQTLAEQSLDDAKLHALKLRDTVEPHVNVYVAEVGKWLPFSDDDSLSEDIEYREQ